MQLADFFLVIFSGIGFYSCGVFAAEAWRMKRGKGGPLEVSCKDGSCLALSRTRWSRIFFGVPNWWFGVGFYLLTILTALSHAAFLEYLDLAATGMALLTSLILIYGLVFRLKAFCRFCYTAHVANFGIALVWLLVLIGK